MQRYYYVCCSELCTTLPDFRIEFDTLGWWKVTPTSYLELINAFKGLTWELGVGKLPEWCGHFIKWHFANYSTWNYSEFLSAMIHEIKCRTQILLDAGLSLVWSWWLLEGLLSIKQDEVSTIKSRWARKSLPYSAPSGKAYANDCCRAMTFCPFNFNILFIRVHLTLLDMSSLMHHTPRSFPSTESHCLSCGQIWCGPGQDHEHRRTSHDDAGRASHIRPRCHDHLNIVEYSVDFYRSRHQYKYSDVKV